jgi:hypothetical protein
VRRRNTGFGADDRGVPRGRAAIGCGADRLSRRVGDGGGGGVMRASSDPHRWHRAVLSHGLLSAARSGVKPVQRSITRPHSFAVTAISPA